MKGLMQTLLRGVRMKYFIYEKRTEKNLSLRELAAMSGVSRTHINEIENGNRHPTVKTLCEIAEVLDVPVTDLFHYDKRKRRSK